MRVIVTGASRGIGAAVARVFASRHPGTAQIALLGRSLSAPSHAGLDGTLLEVARDVEATGSLAIPLQVDLRCAEELKGALHTALNAMDGVDVLVNNASALWVRRDTPPSRMDLVHAVNARATMLCLDACRDALDDSQGAVVTLAPPVHVARLDWIAQHPAYTLSKYSMALATIAAATTRVRANCVWPRYTVATAATRSLEATYPGAWSKGRPARSVASVVHTLATSHTWNARCLYDDEVEPLPPTDAPLDAFAVPAVGSLPGP